MCGEKCFLDRRISEYPFYANNTDKQKTMLSQITFKFELFSTTIEKNNKDMTKKTKTVHL